MSNLLKTMNVTKGTIYWAAGGTGHTWSATKYTTLLLTNYTTVKMLSVKLFCQLNNTFNEELFKNFCTWDIKKCNKSFISNISKLDVPQDLKKEIERVRIGVRIIKEVVERNWPGVDVDDNRRKTTETRE